MSKQDIFIGREKELQMIDEMVFDPTGGNHIWPIIGEGGVGKTWLFREIARSYQGNAKVLVIRIDYAESQTHSLPSLSRYIMRQFVGHIDDVLINTFYEKLADIEIGDIDLAEESLYNFLIKLASGVSKFKRIVILSDSAESAYVLSEKMLRLNSVGSNFQNTVIVVASRPLSKNLASFKTYPEIYSGWVVHDIYELKSFSRNDTTQYFNEFLSWQMPQNLREKIFLLTDGNPLLVAIAGEWFTRHIALPKYVDVPLEALRDKEQLAEYRRLFEITLLEKVLDLRKPIDWAVLYLAFLNRRYDPKILQLALDLDDPELEAVIEELKTLAFVRKSMSTEVGLLHDEAQHLILRHAWPVADPDGAIRRELAQQVIDEYYLPEIERLEKMVQAKLGPSVKQKQATPERPASPPIPDEDWLKRELQMECLDYHFRTSQTLEPGWTYLDQLIDEAETYHYSLIQMAAIEQAIYNLWLDKADPVRYRVRMARILRHKKEFEQARSFAQEALNHPDITPADAAMARSLLTKMGGEVTPD